jgi:hypothetical protein
MSTIVNDLDLLLRSAEPRFGAYGSGLLLTGSSPVIRTALDGSSPTPASVTLTAIQLGAPGVVSWAISGGTLTGSGANVRTLTAANMSADVALVTVTLTYAGIVYSSSYSVAKIRDGSTTYTWVKYADSAAGAGLSDDPTGKTYIGLAYNKATPVESTTAADYSWSLIKGTDGLPGPTGPTGATLYTWIKYSDNADGSGLYDLPTENTLYLGLAVNKPTATESTNPADYVWSKFRGGSGVPGTRGAGNYYATGSSWSDVVASAACPGSTPLPNDTVTISNGTNFVMVKVWTGSAWAAQGTVVDGSLIVPGTVTASKINSNGLELRKPDGTLILGSGTSFKLDYATWVSGRPTSLAGLNSTEGAKLSSIDYGATFGASFDNNIYGQITAANVGTYIASAAIGDAYISNLSASKISTGTLSSIEIYIGSGGTTFQVSSGGVVWADNLIGGVGAFANGGSYSSYTALQCQSVSSADAFQAYGNAYISGNVTGGGTLGTSGNAWSGIYSSSAVVVTSDRSYKTEVEDSDLGLEFINALRPVSYRLTEAQRIVTRGAELPGPRLENEPPRYEMVETVVPGVRRHYGLIAQEVKEALGERDAAFWVLADKDDLSSRQALRYEELIAPMIKALQEMSAEVAALRARVQQLEAGL